MKYSFSILLLSSALLAIFWQTTGTQHNSKIRYYRNSAYKKDSVAKKDTGAAHHYMTDSMMRDRKSR